MAELLLMSSGVPAAGGRGGNQGAGGRSGGIELHDKPRGLARNGEGRGNYRQVAAVQLTSIDATRHLVILCQGEVVGDAQVCGALHVVLTYLGCLLFQTQAAQVNPTTAC